MQTSVETAEGLERRLKVEVPAENVEKEIDARLKDLAHKVKVDGFRPGKVPVRVVQQRYGSSVRQEVVADLMKSTLYEALQREHLHPAGAPQIEPTNVKQGEPLAYVATFEVFPEIKLNAFDGTKIEKQVAKVAEQDIDGLMEKLRKQAAEWVDVERSAAQGDQLTIDFEGKIEGDVFEGGSAKGFGVEIGAGNMIAGFEEGLVGKKAGDETTLELTFPKDYHQQELAGKPVTFAVKIEKVKESKLPEFDDEFAKKFEIEGGIEALRTEMRSNMEKGLQNKIDKALKKQILDKLLALNPLEVPKVLVSQDQQELQKQALQQFRGNLDIAQMGNLPKDLFLEEATYRVKVGLLVNEVIKEHKIEVDAAKVRAKVEEMAASYDQTEAVIAWYYGDEQRLAEVNQMVLEEQVVDVLLKKAEISEKTVSYDDLMEEK